MLGRGGMGIVIAAHDPELDRQVAIKLVHPRLWRLASDEARELLRQEARAMARLVHPNVVTVHDLGTDGDQVFVAMELVNGSSLDAWLAEMKRPWREVLARCVAAGRGVAAAHRAGLVHRDIKPSNVLLDEHGRARIADFGLVLLARAERGGEGAGRDGTSPAGTPAYMSPEQHRVVGATAASDQFSFCVMVYEALYGERPFAGTTAAAIADEIEHGRVRAAPARSPVPGSIRRALLRGLARDPAARWPSMEALLAALEPRARGRWVAAGALVVAAAGAGAAAVTLSGAGETRDHAVRRAAEARATAVWSPAAQRELRTALGGGAAAHAPATGERVVAGIDRYVTGWIATRVEVAGAVQAGAQAAAALEWRMACLDRRLDELRALISELSGGGAGVARRALDGAAALTPPRVCVDRDVATMRPPPEEPARRARHAELVLVLAEVNAKLRLGKRKEASALAERLVADARALADPPLLAEAMLSHAIAVNAAGESDRAIGLYREALVAAANAGEARLEARGWSDLIIQSVNAGRGRPSDDVIMAARAAISRAGNRPDVELPFEQAMAMVAIAEGELAEAEQHWRRALVLVNEAVAPDHPAHAVARLGIASTLGGQRRHEEALAALDEALAVAERIYGAGHPELAPYWGNRSVFAFELGRYEQALAAAEQVVAVAEPGTVHAGLGSLYKAGALAALDRPNDALALYAAAAAQFRDNGNRPEEFQALISLGNEHFNRAENAEARSALEQAMAVGGQVFGPESGVLAYPQALLGAIDVARGDLAAGRRRCADAVAWTERAFGPDDSGLGLPLLCIAMAHRRSGEPAGGRPFAERALALADQHQLTLDQIEARLELGRILFALRGQRARARTMFEEALARITSPERKAEVEAELARLRR